MKSRTTAAILAFIFGVFGIHQFYLGDTRKGMLHVGLFMFSAFADAPIFATVSVIIAVVAAVRWLSMNQDQFDRKYNRRYTNVRRRETHRTGPRRGERIEDERQRRRTEYRRHREERARDRRRGGTPTPQPASGRRNGKGKLNPHKQEGIKLFKEYDYEGAIENFEKALEIAPTDQAVHFNLACAHSLMENKDKALYHLDRLVSLGFKDFKRIKEHDALAYLRVQPEFAAFKKNNYRLGGATSPTPERPDTSKQTAQPALLEQLEKLAAMRDRGLLTEAEFQAQKQRLLG